MKKTGFLRGILSYVLIIGLVIIAISGLIFLLGVWIFAKLFVRDKSILGEFVQASYRSSVAVFGIGGVGGYVTEALARSGVGSMVLVDNDTVSVTNINRQIIATDSTVGMYKTEVMKTRILDINPEAQVEVRNCFYLPEVREEFDFS